MSKKIKFEVKFVVTAEVEVSEEVLDEVMTPEWQSSFYNFPDRQAAANHIAYNMLRGASLTSLDGFAHLKDDDAVIKDEDWDSE